MHFMRPLFFVAALGLAGLTHAESAPFTLPELPYEASALEPVINEETMELHHGKHHQSYIDSLNNELEDDPNINGVPLEEILANVSEHSEEIRNNGGGHWNHTFFWTIMAPPHESGEPSAELRDAIDEAFGSMEEFQQAFQEAGADQFGSGWVWLIVNDEDDLEITSTPNQDNPLMDVADVQGEPILGNDVWEHAYYLSYQNRRGEYLSAWWEVVNWEAVSDNYRRALEE